MPNHVTNRLTLSGPSKIIAKFKRTVVRERRDDEHYDLPSFDFEAVVPIPDSILALEERNDDETRRNALAETGYDNWPDWSKANWGNGWNAQCFEDMSFGDEFIDWIFDTAWYSPHGVLAALATQWPQLSGECHSEDKAMGIGVIARLENGRYSYQDVEAMPRRIRLERD